MIIAQKISIRKFSYSKESKTFVGEVSELYNPFSQIYDDACDIGFIMVNEDTRNEVIFTLSGEDKNDDGETTGWRFESQIKINGVWYHGTYKCLIAND